MVGVLQLLMLVTMARWPGGDNAQTARHIFLKSWNGIAMETWTEFGNHCCMSFTHLGICSTHTHPFNGPFSGTTRVSRYQKGKTNLDFTEARDSEHM